MSAGHNRAVPMLLALVAVIGAGSTLAYRECRAQHRNREARQFIDALIPKLIEFKNTHGRYPAFIPESWYAGKPLPQLVQGDFYLDFDEGQEFLMRFRDPRADPRFWWNDTVAYQSNIGYWAQWDGY